MPDLCSRLVSYLLPSGKLLCLPAVHLAPTTVSKLPVWWMACAQAVVEVIALVDTMQAIGLSMSLVEVVADRFMTAESVSWSDVRDAGVSGRDIVRVRQCLVGKVRGLAWRCCVAEGPCL